MSTEADAVAAAREPATRGSLLRGLRALGVVRGDTLIVHCAMSAMGWVCGREATVVDALLAAVGPLGTLVMPAHSGDNSEPADWCNPPVPQDWYETIHAEMPAYRRRMTPTRCMGRVAECFRTWPGTRRSAHPHVSWCARGLTAAWLLRGHRFGRPCFGPKSPLGRLYRRNAKILLLGVGYGNCTALHLAETLYPGTPTSPVGAAVRLRGRRRWAGWREIEMDSDRFPRIGEAYEQAGGEALHGRLGQADYVIVRVRPLVDFGVDWLTRHAGETADAET